MKTQPVIAHINKQYFAKSETFMYFYLSHFRRVHPVCLCWAPFINNDIFPFPAEDCYSIGTARPALRRNWVERLTVSPSPAARILRRRKARLIHAHYGPVGWWALPLQQELGLPLVTNFYGYDMAPELEEEGKAWPMRRQELFERGDLFVVEGPFMRQRLLDLGCPAGKIHIQRIAIGLRSMPFAVRQPDPDGRARVLFAGRFYEKKGLMYALEAFHTVWRSGRNVEFAVIGDGPLAPQVKSFIAGHGMENSVRLLGFLNHRDYLSAMQRAHIFLHPSVTSADGDSEGGAPTTILEAQALGMPVVSTYHADIPNVVVPGKSALLSPERDSESLANALVRLIDNPSSWAEMGKNGRAHMEMYHDIEREVPKLEEQYLHLLA